MKVLNFFFALQISLQCVDIPVLGGRGQEGPQGFLAAQSSSRVVDFPGLGAGGIRGDFMGFSEDRALLSIIIVPVPPMMKVGGCVILPALRMM